jgi:hypothetical protein
MFDVYNLMKAGYSADDLAKEFADSINAAEAQIQEEEAARLAEEQARLSAAEAARIAEKAQAQKRGAFETIIYDLYDTIAFWYPDIMEEEEDDDREEKASAIAELVIKILDQAAENERNAADYANIFNNPFLKFLF